MQHGAADPRWLLLPVRLVLACAALACCACASTPPPCGASTFSRDLGSTHCPSLAQQKKANTSADCAKACCEAGDACDAWQWCEAGKACAQGYNAQVGSIARGSDLDGWPRNTTIDVAEAACSASPSCVGLTYHSNVLHPDKTTTLNIYLKNTSYTSFTSSWSRHMKVTAGCYTGRLDGVLASAIDGWTARALPPRPEGPCDILAAAHTPCVAAHSLVRALYGGYAGPLYRVLRDSDKAGLDIGINRNSGVAKMSDQDNFCAGTSCFVVRIYDQSPRGNHLDTSPAGGACRFPLSPVNASKERISLGGSSVYGAVFEGKMGYRNDKTSGVATGETEETMYMVTRGDHVNGGCCFDYGNAETNNDDDGQGTMEAVYFGTSGGWGHGQGKGPWVMADLENGLWAGSQKASPAPSITYKYATAMAKGKKGGFALKGGNAQKGGLQTLYEGQRPAGYETMNKQGAIILGIGGDNSCGAIGTFYEGVMTANYTADATDEKIQANIVAAGYGN